MAIAKKPLRHQDKSEQEKVAQRFIASAGQSKSEEQHIKRPTTLRFDPDLLARIDAAAKRRGVSRSAWIQYTLSRALDEER